MIRSIHNNENSFSQVVYVISNLVHNFFRQKATLVLPITIMFLGTSIDAVYASQPTAFTYAVQPVTFVERIVPEPIDIQSIRVEDELREREGGPYRFAIPRTIMITPDANGMWEEIDDDTLLWRIQITSPGARSISLGFTRYLMPPGGSLFIYSADQKQVLGPFTEDDNEGHGQLWTPLIHSDDIVVELTITVSEVSQLELELTYINHGYRGFNPLLVDKGLGDSDYCHVNVACPEGDPWRDQIRSVARYHITLADGSFWCTGVLINNTVGNDKNYFLTAFHCFDEWLDGVLADPDSAAASMVIYWNFEVSTCSGTTGSESQNQSGAIFRAAYNPTDFTLVELDDMPSPAFSVYYAGWDRGSAAPSSGVAVHHPQGDLKKISFEYQPLSVTSFGGYSSPGDGTHLRVADWDYSSTNEGTTETGSSGCPIFNSSKRITGTLHGGLAACGNDESDWFGRFYKSWTGGGTSSTRLSNWLDPLASGVTFLDGKDPPPTYCSASGGCDEYISGVVVGTINNTGTGCDGYADYTAMSTSMEISQSYDITVTNGNPYSSDQCGIWIDWNHDLDFYDPGETIGVNGTPGYGPYTASITVPADAALGDTRMRIRITYTGDVNTCGDTTYGEVEDYTITVPDSACNTITIGTGISEWTYPMHTFYHDSRTQVIYLASEIGSGGTITALGLDVTTVPGQTMNNWTIRMKHTGMSSYSTASLEVTGWTVVYEANEPAGSTGWRTFTFSTPFTYNGTDNLLVDFSHNNSSYTSNGKCIASSPGGTRSAYAYSDSGYGDDPLSWSGTTLPTVYGSTYVPNVQLTINIPGDFEPDCDVDFVDFAWFAPNWMDTTCGVCGGADLTGDGNVNWADLREFSTNWLAGVTP